jgi:Tfp pilus assembly PilM family ATPase
MALNLSPSWARLLARVNGARRPRRPRRSSLTALDFDGDQLQVVQAALRGGQPRVIRQRTLQIESPVSGQSGQVDDPAALGRVLAAALAQGSVSPGSVVLGIPRAQVLLRTFELPPTDREEEIAAMVHLRWSRDLPFPVDEAVIDFQTLPRPSAPDDAPPATAPDGTPTASAGAPTRVLTAVVRRKTVEFYQALAKAAGLKLIALGLRSLAGAQAALACQPQAATGCLALVSLHPQEVRFDVLLDGTWVFSRIGALPAPSEQTSPANDALTDPAPDAVLLEVVRSLHSYEGTAGHSPVSRVLVTGTTGREAHLAEALARQLGVPGDVLAPEPGSSDLSATAESLPHTLPAVGLALGALAPAGLPFDFLDPKRPPVVRDLRRVRRLAVVAGVLAVLLTTAGLRARWITERERQRADLQTQVTLGSKNLGAYRLFRSQARTLHDWSTASRNWLDHLTLLSALLPPSQELYVTALSTTARNTLNLSVKVRSGETVDRLTSTLRSAGYDVKAPAIMPSTDRFGFRFQANLELEVPTTLTNDLDGLTIEARASPTSAPPAAPGSNHPPIANAPANPTPTEPASPSVTANPEARGPRNRRRRPEGGGGE